MSSRYRGVLEGLFDPKLLGHIVEDEREHGWIGFFEEGSRYVVKMAGSLPLEIPLIIECSETGRCGLPLFTKPPI